MQQKFGKDDLPLLIRPKLICLAIELSIPKFRTVSAFGITLTPAHFAVPAITSKLRPTPMRKLAFIFIRLAKPLLGRLGKVARDNIECGAVLGFSLNKCLRGSRAISVRRFVVRALNSISNNGVFCRLFGNSRYPKPLFGSVTQQHYRCLFEHEFYRPFSDDDLTAFCLSYQSRHKRLIWVFF